MKENNELGTIVSLLKKIDLPGNRSIYSLPNNLVYVVNDNDCVSEMYGVMEGIGHEPEIFEKMIQFMQPGENFIEVGANYGDYSIQMAKILGETAKVYAFEPGRKVFKYLETNLFLNGLPNLIAEEVALLDEDLVLSFIEVEDSTLGSYMGVSTNSHKTRSTTLNGYFKNNNISIGGIRLDSQGAECKVLKGASNIIDSSPNIKLFIAWEHELINWYNSKEEMQDCLSSLTDKGFIFLDLLNFKEGCDYSNYILPAEYIIKSLVIEFLAIRESTLKEYLFQVEENPVVCNATTNYLFFDAVLGNNNISAQSIIFQGVDVNYLDKAYKANSLHIATQNGNKEIVEMILNAGANIEQKALNTLTSLCIAVQNKHSDIVQLLIDKNANVECVFPSGANALYVSAYLGDTKTAITLLKAGAKKDVIIDGKDLVARANYGGYTAIANLFELGVDEFCQQTIETGRDSGLITVCEG
jgi:FkbM family methyltransferase